MRYQNTTVILSSIQYKKLDKGKYQIEMALAGFTKSDIECELQEGVNYSSQERKQRTDSHATSRYRIKKCCRKFTLSEYIKVDFLPEDGIDTLKLYEEIPEEKNALKTIKIK